MPFKKGFRILKHQGIIKFTNQFFSFLYKNIFVFRKYNLYEMALFDLKKKHHLLKDRRFRLVIIKLPSEVDRLVENGFKFGCFQDICDIKKMISKDAILFCVFHKKNWAHTSWASIKNGSSIDPFFKKLKYQNMGYIGTCSTNTTYRGLGLYPYVLLEICNFLIKKGMSIANISTAKSNIASITGISKAGFSYYSEGYNLTIVGLKFWVVKTPYNKI